MTEMPDVIYAGYKTYPNDCGSDWTYNDGLGREKYHHSRIVEALQEENKRLREDIEREVRESAKLLLRQKAWEDCVYSVGLPMMKVIRDTEYGDPVAPIPVVNKVTDLLDAIYTHKTTLEAAEKALEDNIERIECMYNDDDECFEYKSMQQALTLIRAAKGKV